MKPHHLILCIAILSALNLRADESTSAAPTPSAPGTVPAAIVSQAPTMRHTGQPTSFNAPQSTFHLTPEEAQVMSKARMELQKDPELIDLNNQIKALMDKRMKLTEEKMQKISPEAAAVFQKIKEQQEKMMADRKAQMEAMQAKMKAQHEGKVPLPTTTTAPASNP